MLLRWNFTVCSVTQNSRLIALFESPRASAFKHGELALGEPDVVARLRLAAAVDVEALEHRRLERLA